MVGMLPASSGQRTGPTVTRTAPTTKNYLVPNVNRAEAEKAWLLENLSGRMGPALSFWDHVSDII